MSFAAGNVYFPLSCKREGGGTRRKRGWDGKKQDSGNEIGIPTPAASIGLPTRPRKTEQQTKTRIPFTAMLKE